MSPTPEHPATIAAECHKSLSRIDIGLRWAYSAGWYPGRRWVGEPRGAEMRLAKSSTDDQVPGSRDDIGMGDYHARRAVRSAGPALSVASARVGDAVLVMACAHHVRSVPRPVSLTAVESLPDLRRAVRQIDAQLDRITDPDLYDVLNDLSLAHVAGRLSTARGVLSSIESRLRRWSEGVPESHSVPMPMCVTCNSRPRPIRRGIVVGRECDTCATWRHRHKGQPRPKSLDNDERRDVIDAAKRRALAGQGWGMG